MSEIKNVASATTTNSGKSEINNNVMNVNANGVNVENGASKADDVVVMETYYVYDDDEAVTGVLVGEDVYTNPYDKNDSSRVNLRTGQMYNRDGAAMRLMPGMQWLNHVLVVSKDVDNKKVRLFVMTDQGGDWVEDYRSSYSPYVECENYVGSEEEVSYYVNDETGEEWFELDGNKYYASEENLNRHMAEFYSVCPGGFEELWNDDDVIEARKKAMWIYLYEYDEDDINAMLNEQYPMDVVVDAPGIRYEMDYEEAIDEVATLNKIMAKIDEKAIDKLTDWDYTIIRNRLSDIRDMVHDATQEAVAEAY